MATFPSPYAVGYCRVSTSEQATHGWSIGRQEEVLRQAAERHGLQLLSIFTDPGKSGTSLRRPGLRQCLELIAQKGIGVLLVTRQDRLSRTLTHALALRCWIHGCDTDLLLVEDGKHLRAAEVKTGALHDTLILDLAAILAEQEITTHKDRVLPNLKEAALHGRRGGRVPLGYCRREDGSIAVEPHDAAILARCVARVLAGVGVSTLVRELVAQGVRDHRGELLSFDRLKGALTNPFLTGTMRYRLPVALHDADPVITIPDHHPRLVDPTTFAQLQGCIHGGFAAARETVIQRRHAQRQRLRERPSADLLEAVRPSPRPVHGALSPDIVRCGHCQGPMYCVLQTQGSRGDRRRVPIYQCRYHKDRGAAFCPQGPAPVDRIDEAVFGRLLRSGIWSTPQAPSLSAPLDTRSLVEVQQKVDRLTQSLSAMGAQAPPTLQGRLQAAQEELARLRTQAQLTPSAAPGLAGPAQELCQHPQATWIRLDAAARREALRPFLRRVVIRDQAVVTLELAPTGRPPATPETSTASAGGTP